MSSRRFYQTTGENRVAYSCFSTPPSNCRFETGDASAGLKQYGRFDVIHARSVLQGVKDYAALCADIAEVLNPQGIFISIEGETGLYDKNKVKYGPQKEGDPVRIFIEREMVVAYESGRPSGFLLVPRADDGVSRSYNGESLLF